MENLSIKDASKRLHVEPHVLRYWEEELSLVIKRNEMGHRYYDERDIHLFESVMELKKKGLSLKEIRDAIDSARNEGRAEEKARNTMNNDMMEDNRQEQYTQPSQEVKIVDFKHAQLQTIMNKVVATALRENRDILTDSIKAEITSDVMRQFDAVMREKEEKEEARFRKIDEYLRQLQQAHDEVAATKSRGRFGILGRRK